MTLGDSDLKKAIEESLESILNRNRYKLANVEVKMVLDGSSKNEINKQKSLLMDCSQMDDQVEIERLKAKSNARRLDAQIKDFTKKQQEQDDQDGEKLNFQIGIRLNKNKKKDFIKHNFTKVMDQKSMIRLIMRSNPPLVSQNIPFLSNATRFTRGEMHTLYTLYKALCFATSQYYGVMEYDVADGIDERVFRKGVYQVFIQSDFLAERIFQTIDYNFSSFMNWPEFIDGMQMIKAKTLSEKIGLFIKVTPRLPSLLIKTATNSCLETRSRSFARRALNGT